MQSDRVEEDVALARNPGQPAHQPFISRDIRNPRWRDMVMQLLQLPLNLLPDFVLNSMDFDRASNGAVWSWAAIELVSVVLLLTLPHRFTIVTDDQEQRDFWNIEDDTLDTLGDVIWRGRFSYVGVTTVLCIAMTWSTGYIPLDMWDRYGFESVSLSELHVTLSYVRFAIPPILAFLNIYNIWETALNLLDILVMMIGVEVWLGCAWATAILHLGIAGINHSITSGSRSRIFRSSYDNPATAGPQFNPVTGYVMRLAPATLRRSRYQEVQRMVQCGSLPARNDTWYHPKGIIDMENPSFWEKTRPSWLTRLFAGDLYPRIFVAQPAPPTTGNGQDYSLDTMFSHCYCCLDSVTEAIVRDPFRLATEQTLWGRHRQAMLEHNVTVLEENAPAMHVLCSSCESICGQSDLLDGFRHPTFQRFVKYAKNAVGAMPLAEELFEHSPSFSALQRSATEGCHLCNLIIDTLSQEQQTSLTYRDAQLERQIRDVEDGSGARGNFRDQFLRRDRAIFLKILAPPYFRRAASGTFQYGTSSLLVVPHFGYARLPRRWLQQRQVDYALSLHKDLALQWDLEQVEPIEVRATDPQDRNLLYHGASTSTASTINMSRILRWSELHRHRQDHHSTAELPSRLICVTGNDLSMVQIVLTADLNNPRYVALSYCWRPQESKVLTASSAKAGILIKDLAPTIQDAIKVTLLLGFHYLWVDALCITQDSQEDKDLELPKMAFIYNHAEIVIAAAASKDSSESMIREQNPLAFNPCLIGVRDQPQGKKHGKAGAFRGIYALPSRRYTTGALDEVEYSRLTSRGWVFQEQRLAQRIVYFTNSQVIMHCNECNATTRQADWESTVPWSWRPFPDAIRPDIFSQLYQLLFSWSVSYLPSLPRSKVNEPSRASDSDEDSHSDEDSYTEPDYVPDSQRPSYRRYFQKLKKNPSKNLDTSAVNLNTSPTLYTRSSAHEVHALWFRLVEGYTQRFLTNSSDRLPAINGLAQRLHQAVIEAHSTDPDTHYHWGLFDTPQARVASLLWYVSDRQTTRPLWRAPSWTWASVDGCIKNNSTMCSPYIRESGVKIGRFGEALGHLLVQAKLRVAAIRAVPEDPQRYYVGHRQIIGIDSPYYHQQFIPVVEDADAGPEVLSLCDLDGTRVGYFVPDAVGELPALMGGQDELLREIYCMQIIVRPLDEAGEQDFAIPWAVRGLALTRCDGESYYYRRIGYIELSREHEGIEKSAIGRDRARNRAKRSFPEIDKHNFFEDIDPTNFWIV